MTNPSERSTPAGARKRETLQTAALVVAILLCSASCVLMFMLSPRSIAVDSVYAGF